MAEIKSDPELKSIPVVVFTTSASPMDVNEAYELHANCYVIKPVDLQALFETIGAIGTFWLQVAKVPMAETTL